MAERAAERRDTTPSHVAPKLQSLPAPAVEADLAEKEVDDADSRTLKMNAEMLKITEAHEGGSGEPVPVGMRNTLAVTEAVQKFISSTARSESSPMVQKFINSTQCPLCATECCPITCVTTHLVTGALVEWR